MWVWSQVQEMLWDIAGLVMQSFRIMSEKNNIQLSHVDLSQHRRYAICNASFFLQIRISYANRQLRQSFHFLDNAS